MKRISLLTGAILGALTALALVGLTYLGGQLVGLPFVPFDTFDWMTRVLPGGVITFVIDTMVRIIGGLNIGPTSAVAKSTEQTIAIVQFILAGAVFGVLLAAVGRARPERLVRTAALLGLILVVPTTFVEVQLGFPAAGPLATVLWLAVVFVGWGMGLARLVLETAPEPLTPPGANLSRRQFLYLVGAGSFTVLVTALGVNILSQQGEPGKAGGNANADEMLGAGDTSGPAASPPQDALEARFDPVPGTRPELTSNDDFYRIDINTVPPEVDGETWQLEVGGLVFQPLTLSLADLRSRPSVSQAITLSCISNEIGGDLISTSVWTGVRFKDILEQAGLRRGVQEIAIEAVDGFYESVPLDEAMDERTLLVYEMNGEPLPVKHGYPLRIYIPNHYGMKQPKWIKRMEAIDHHAPGYWVDRGWSETAIPKTTSVIDAVALDAEDPQAGTLPVGGIAYAGARGIGKVEIQVDDGPWQAAELRSPALSPLTWVQWRYLWKYELGRHTFKVRSYDGTGQLQETAPSPPHPNGATGIDSKTENVRS